MYNIHFPFSSLYASHGFAEERMADDAVSCKISLSLPVVIFHFRAFLLLSIVSFLSLISSNIALP